MEALEENFINSWIELTAKIRNNMSTNLLVKRK